MAPQSPEADRWKTWCYYSQGSEAFKGDLYFYSVDHDLRGKLGEIDTDKCAVVLMTGDYDYLTTPEDSARTASQIHNGEFIEMKDIGHFPMSENYPVFKGYLVQALNLIRTKTSVRAWPILTYASVPTQEGRHRPHHLDGKEFARRFDVILPCSWHPNRIKTTESRAARPHDFLQVPWRSPSRVLEQLESGIPA